MRVFGIALAGSLVLSGCSDPSEQAGQSSQSDGGFPAVPEASPPIEPASNGIPAQFQGVWDYTQGSCALESDLRMEITSDEIVFYESIGIVTDVAPLETETKDGGVIVTLAMEGEGETWVQKTQLSMDKSGEFLETQALGDGIVGDPLPRKRCPE